MQLGEQPKDYVAWTTASATLAAWTTASATRVTRIAIVAAEFTKNFASEQTQSGEYVAAPVVRRAQIALYSKGAVGKVIEASARGIIAGQTCRPPALKV